MNVFELAVVKRTAWMLAFSAATLVAGAADAASVSTAPFFVPREPLGSQTQVTGQFTVNLSFVTSADLPEGTPISIFIAAGPSDPSFNDSASAEGTATVAKGKASFTVTLPYLWQVSSTDDDVSISISASAAGQGDTASYSNFTNLSQTLPLPKDGAKTKVNLHTSI